MAIKKCPSDGSPFSKRLIVYLFISIVGLQLSSAGNLIDEDDNQTNQISSIESIALIDNATIINSTTMVSLNQNSSSQSTESTESSTSPRPLSPSTPTESPPPPTTTTTTTTTSTTTLPPPLPTPLPSKGHPKLYSDSPQSLYMVMDNLLKSKASYLGRTKRMKRSRPNIIPNDSSSGNPFSLIKYLLANHITSPSDYPAGDSLANPKPGLFGSIYSSNLEDSLNRNDLSSGSMMMNRINSRINPEQSVSFYPLTTNDIEALELTSEGDDSFDSGFGGGNDGWSNQGTIDLINQLETDGSYGNSNPNNNNVDTYPMDPFIPLRSFRSIPTHRSQSELLMRPIIAMKRKRRQNGSYLFKNNDKSPDSIVLGSSLFGGDNRYRLNVNQYEQLINRINDNPNA